MATKLAKLISVIFHPVLIPTLGFFLLFNSGFYFSILNWEAKRFVLLVVLFSTGILPIMSVAILALNPKFNILMENSRDRIIPLLSSSIFYYIGFMLLGRMKAFPVFKLFLIASVLVIIVLLFISFKWKISNHMAAVGGMTGTMFALSFRSGVNPIFALLTVVLISGLVGSARLILNKHSIPQVIAGYGLGFSVLYLVIYFI
ncbi:MAG: PAP2 family protein [Bacteroidetes bacterium]|nr:PAP2 family protein [Bacteroidota bacterium]